MKFKLNLIITLLVVGVILLASSAVASWANLINAQEAETLDDLAKDTLLNQASIECLQWQAEGRIINGEMYCFKIVGGTSAIISLKELKGEE